MGINLKALHTFRLGGQATFSNCFSFMLTQHKMTPKLPDNKSPSPPGRRGAPNTNNGGEKELNDCIKNMLLGF